MANRQYAVVVDPTSSGGLLAGELKGRGIESIAVHSQPLLDIPLAKSYFSQDYSDEFVLEDDYDKLVEQISNYHPIAVFPGNEPGVALADRLVDTLSLRGNDIRLSKSRTDKYQMQEALRAAGLRAIEQVRSADLETILDWISDRNALPVVVKPLSSGGTDCVRLCDSVAQVKEAFNAVLETTNLFGYRNREVLVQERIQGEEYVVDSTSCDSNHFVLEICKYRKVISVSGAPTYREMRFYEPNSKEHGELIAYNEKALKALGIAYGASHSEIMMTNEGPIMIETGARMSGVLTPRNIRKCARFSQLETTVDSVLDQDEFFAKVRRGQKFHKYATTLFLWSNEGGRVRAFPGKKVIENLPSFDNGIWKVAAGGYQSQTIDVASSPAYIFLAHEDLSVLNKDVAFIESMEDENRLLEFEQ